MSLICSIAERWLASEDQNAVELQLLSLQSWAPGQEDVLIEGKHLLRAASSILK